MVSAASPLTAPEMTARAGGLGDSKRLTAQERLVHGGRAHPHHAIDRTDLVRQNDDLVARGDPIDRNVDQRRALTAMGHARVAPGEGREYGRGAACGVSLQGLAARQHQHDDRGDEILAKHDGRDDRQAREQVGAEVPRQDPTQQCQQERKAADGDDPEQRHTCH